MVAQLRHAWRRLRHQPAFALPAVITLAIGIGAMTAISGVVNAVLLKPLPYADSDRLVGLWHRIPKYSPNPLGQSDATYLVYESMNRSLAAVGAYNLAQVSVTEAGEPERVLAAGVSPSVFTVLGVAPILGRALTSRDAERDHASVVVLSEGMWRRRFGAAPDVIGRTIILDGVSHEIVGVVPARMKIPLPETQLWRPLVLEPTNAHPGALDFGAIGRLREGVSAAEAAADLQRILARLPEQYPTVTRGLSTESWLASVSPRVEVHALRDDVVGDVGKSLWVVLGTVAFVLFAACANVAGLCLVHAESRRTEIAVRTALGANRAQVFSTFLAEAAILAAGGALIGVSLAAGALRILRLRSSIPIPRLDEIAIDWRVLVFVAVITLVVGLVTTAIPVARVGTGSIAHLVRSGSRGATGDRSLTAMQSALVVTQIGLAFVLLTSSLLMTRTMLELRRVRLGFNPASVLTFRLQVPPQKYPQPRDVLRFLDGLSERLAGLRGVEVTAFTSKLPLAPEGAFVNALWTEGADQVGRETPGGVPIALTSSHYFGALGVPFLSGRPFDPIPPDRGSEEAIVSASLAARAWGDPTGRAALGRRLRLAPTAPWLTVIGVVADVRDASVDQPASDMVYLPLGTAAFTSAPVFAVNEVSAVLRVRGAPLAFAPASRRELGLVDHEVPAVDLRAMDDVVRQSMARTTFTTALLVIATAVALTLGLVGLYGVTAYALGRRAREVGLRLALGASPGSVQVLLAKQGLALAVGGIAIGVLGSLLSARLLQALLYGVTATEPATLAGTAAALMLVTGVASLIPARRASRLDPATILRTE